MLLCILFSFAHPHHCTQAFRIIVIVRPSLLTFHAYVRSWLLLAHPHHYAQAFDSILPVRSLLLTFHAHVRSTTIIRSVRTGLENSPRNSQRHGSFLPVRPRKKRLPRRRAGDGDDPTDDVAGQPSLRSRHLPNRNQPVQRVFMMLVIPLWTDPTLVHQLTQSHTNSRPRQMTKPRQTMNRKER